MNKKRWVVIAVLAFMMIFVSSGMAYVSHTIHQYSGTCSKLTGFPLMLQRMNFVPSGDCKSKDGGITCQDSAACTISNPPSGKSNKGKCTQLTTGSGKDKHNSGCVCQ